MNGKNAGCFLFVRQKQPALRLCCVDETRTKQKLYICCIPLIRHT
ncbi:hypothetical protein HMPREF9098_1006 [Kingella denitrificans ATCC 33394]|uniref:Uncharacterized protein n=1 Tax=Kingella denitrificans ATCC 33394 TaxID=888741 RepID=F0EYS2_9NEIS|nr:hypothetical protein HMPREF9098_1006 [Kingella denitrificans ATCC 33394]